MYNKGGKNIQWKKKKIAASISGAGKTGQLHVEEWNYYTPEHHTQK